VIYLAYLDGRDLPPDTPGPWRELRGLCSGLLFVDSDQSRSVVYHALKDQLPRGTPLLVAELDEAPQVQPDGAGLAGVDQGAHGGSGVTGPRRSLLASRDG
jgi:hypothetical protein